MKHVFLVLILFVGLGSHFSFSQADDPSPFDRYLAGLKNHDHEAALIQFAGDCGIDTSSVAPRYAQSPEKKWVPVKDLSKALQDQETDFYATVAIWHVADRILIEHWGIELDTGNFSRQLICLRQRKIVLTETTDWTIPPVENAQQRTSYPAWGYEQRWKLASSRRYEKISSEFVDTNGRPIKAPALDAETKAGLDSKWQAYSWKDLDFPDALLSLTGGHQ